MVDDDRLARLTPAQRRLYEKRLREKQDAPARAADEELRPRCVGPGPHALSFPQERFWFLDQLEPGSAEYNVTGAARVRGRLDRRALARALDDVVARQASLRTTFPAVHGVPGQFVHPATAVEMPVEDLRDVPPTEREAELARRLQTFARRPFDLARGPLFRVLLVALADEDHVFVVGMHHAVCDGWSLAILVRELSVLYRAHSGGAAVALPPLAIQYADHAARQRARVSGPGFERLLAYWRTALAGAPSSLELPCDRPRRGLSTHAGRTLRWTFEPELARALRELSAAEGVTQFALLLAAFQAFLARLTGTEDVVVGTSIANRDRREIEDVVGAFVNTLVLRTSCAGDPTFRELAARARTTVRDAHAHAEMPFEKLVAELASVREPSRTPLFNVYFDMGVPRPRPKWDGLEYSELPFEHGNALFDLSLSIEDASGSIAAAFEYSTELFDAATIERLRRLFAHFLARAVADPSARLSRIPLLDDAERAAVVESFNATALPYDRGDHAHRRMSSRAAAAPDAIALEDGPHRLTYAELDARANQLARVLMRNGAGPGARVAVCLPRSIEAIVALYAVWKSGAAYVPLEVEDPPPRWIDRLTDVGATALVARADVLARATEHAGARVDVDSAEIARESPADPGVATQPDSLAYVLFTSGSTGRPKGVMIEHGALANHLAWVRAAFDLRDTDRFLLRTPFTFDASLWEIVHPLASGATLVVAPQETGRDPTLLLDLCARARITILQTVPSLLRVWLAEPRFAGCRALRHLICAGEALDPDLWKRFASTTRSLGLSIALHNLYGPSEACIDATWHTLAPEDAERELDAIPIGRPISNARAYVLDRSGDPVPIGVVGELWLGGDGLGRGYWDDAELTAQRFVPDAFGLGRLYRTGDLARWLPDGTLAYVGRADRQLKLSGVRVEPGEIESELRAHPDIRDAAVVSVRRDAHDARLQAFVVPVEGRALDPRELREFLGKRLPRHLVPASLAVLDELPLTTSLKTDLRALERIALTTASEREHEPPRSDTEARIADFAADLLGVERVGRADDFFALGGHSLLAAQLVARVREHWRVEFPLSRFFDGPNVAALAGVVDEALAHGGSSSTPRIERRGGTVRALSPAQEGLWTAQALEPDSTLYDVSGGLRLRGALDERALERAFALVVERHEILRSTYDDDGGVLRARVHAATTALARRDLSNDPRGSDAALAAYLDVESRHVFDLRRGPLVRAALLALGRDDHVLALDVHHIVADGWSLELLVSELAHAYADLVAGRVPDMPPLEVQYADWAEWQRAHSSDADARALADWWRAALAGAPPRAHLPLDRREPAAASHAGATVDFALDPPLVDALRRYARERRTSLHAVLTAAYAAVLRRTGADSDLVVGTVVGIRPQAVLESVIGPFVNVVPIRVDLRGAPTFDELVRRVASASNAALAHAALPFERIASALAPARVPGREPFLSVACDLESFPASRARFPGLDAELVHVDPRTSKLDASFTFVDDGSALVAHAQYRTALFDRETVDGWTRRFRELLAAALTDPARSIDTLAFVAEPRTAPPERAAVESGSLLDRFEHHARNDPASIAYEIEDRRCNHGELDARAERWAARLRQLGAGPETIVALSLERSIETAALVLGAWKARAAWIGLDPREPFDERALEVRASRALVVVAEPDEVAAWKEAGFVALSADEASDVRTSPSASARRPIATDLACVLPVADLAGGSRLVALDHRALTLAAAVAASSSGTGPGRRCLHHHPLSSAIGLLELASVLGSGGTVVALPPRHGDDARAIAGAIESARVDTAFASPLLVAELLDEPRFTPRTNLAALVCVGDALPARVAARFDARFGARATLYRAYAPPEAPLGLGLHACGAFEADPVPVGRDPHGERARILGAHGRAEPAGIAGELWLRGPGLARGYLHDAARTESAFAPDADRPGELRFRTGLRARVAHDGRVVVLGRCDTEVEIAGRPVRIDAVESALAEHPTVRAAVVEARASSSGALELVAHVVPEPGLTVDFADLHAHARARLAPAWIPTAWRVAANPPRTRDRGIDRAALARVPRAEFRTAALPAPLAPRNELEAALHARFATALGRDTIGVREDFFALGGTSLAAMRLVAELRAQFDVELPLIEFYAAATIDGVARAIDAARTGRTRAAHAIDYAADARLGPEFPERVVARWDGPPRRWLLTGATGYLGAFLLRGLLDRGAERVHVLVRARDDAQGLARVRENLSRYGLATGDLERVSVVVGDLGEPDLGLDAARRERLAHEVDGIVHSGASVNFLADYARLRAANVLGTRALLDIAARRGLPFHHVSTIGVYAPTADRARVRREDDPLPPPDGLLWGYEQTKWVAEQLVAAARARGLGVTIHRPGRISGSARNGAWNLDDFAARMVRGIVALGAAPDLDVAVDTTPVDWVADAIVHLAASKPRGAAYHLAHPRPPRFLEMFDRLRERGATVRVVPLGEWFALARAAIARRPGHELAPLFEMLGALRHDVDAARLVPDVDLPRLDSTNTWRDVIGAGLECPPIDDRLRDLWIDGFVRAGAIELPGSPDRRS